MKQRDKSRFSPIMMAVCVVFGILLGTFYANHFSGNRLNIINTGGNRLTNLLHIISDRYVDNVNIDSLVTKAIPQILSELDPHSVYISADEVQAATEDLKGSFSGVGIEFVIRKDTLRVQNVVKNSPAEKAGLLAGDKIVEIDDSAFVGKKVVNEEAMRRLKGPKDTKVKLGVIRYGKDKTIKRFTVTRGDIPRKTVVAAYMADENTGYIKIRSFGETTYAEMLIALAKLSQKGFSNLIVDLRDNTGGYLQQAVNMINEFLPKDRLIVYTEGLHSKRQEFRSDGRGTYSDIPLVVLINEASASAAEIFAGAIQDNDRGTVIGRRSFGKGLVQEQLGFSDGSLIRLTVARYYTPSGRCIQKPYVDGNDKSYEEDLIDRYKHGEFFSQDSIHHTGPAYYTLKKREVYGGGGITPDIFIPEDTTDVTSYYKLAAASGLIFQFCFDYTDNNRAKLSEYNDIDSMLVYLKRQGLLNKFVVFGEKNGLRRRNLMIKKSRKLLEKFIYSRIIYTMLDEEKWIQYLNSDDEVMAEAVKVMVEGKAFPKAVEKKDGTKEKDAE